MKYLLVLTVLLTSIQADKYNDFLNYLNKKDYEKACKVGKKIMLSSYGDEKLTSLIAQSCLKCDYIYALSIAQNRLRETKSARADAVAFSSVVLQKKLIYQFMYDDADISTLFLPVVDHPLSHAFSAIRDGNYTVSSKRPKVITFKKDDKRYKLYIDRKDKGRVIIEIIDSNNKRDKRRYI